MDNTLTDNPYVDSAFKNKIVSDNNPRTSDTLENNLHILPLRYWWIAIAMVVVFIGGVSGWQIIFQEPEVPPAHKYNIERLTTPTEELRIVSMGDSYTRYALPFDGMLEKIALEKGLSLKYTRFVKDAGKPEHFAVLLPHILAARPDFVFLLAEPFLAGFPKTKEKLLDPFRMGITNIKKIVSGQETEKMRSERRLHTQNTEGGVDNNFDLTAKPEKVEEHLKRLKEQLIVFEPQMPEVYEEFFKAAQAQGTRVVLLDIGHSKALKAALPSEFNDQVTSNLAKLGASYKIDVWSFPSTLPLTHFTDVTHLNIKGRQVFVNWFLGRLMDVAKKND